MTRILGRSRGFLYTDESRKRTGTCGVKKASTFVESEKGQTPAGRERVLGKGNDYKQGKQLLIARLIIEERARCKGHRRGDSKG